MYNKFKVANWPKLDSNFKFLLEFWKLPFYFLLHKHPFIVCFHMTSWWPYLCPKTMKRRPCLCPKPILWVNAFFCSNKFA